MYALCSTLVLRTSSIPLYYLPSLLITHRTGCCRLAKSQILDCICAPVCWGRAITHLCIGAAPLPSLAVRVQARASISVTHPGPPILVHPLPPIPPIVAPAPSLALPSLNISLSLSLSPFSPTSLSSPPPFLGHHCLLPQDSFNTPPPSVVCFPPPQLHHSRPPTTTHLPSPVCAPASEPTGLRNHHHHHHPTAVLLTPRRPCSSPSRVDSPNDLNTLTRPPHPFDSAAP